mgnify:CR=1 FL=1
MHIGYRNDKLIRNYLFIIKQNRIFKIISHFGSFGDFLDKNDCKIYFKIPIPYFLNSSKKLKLSWYKYFCEELCFLHSSGISIVESMEIFRKNAEMSKNKVMVRFYSNIHSKLLKGNSLHDSLSTIDYKFDKLFLSLIKISEDTGNLSIILKNLSSYYEEKIIINNKLKSSLMYPALLLTFLIIVFNLCILYFIPSYVNSFQSQLNNLSSVSLFFINMCLYIKQNYLFILIFTSLISFCLIKNLRFRKLIFNLIFKIPVFKKNYFKNCQIKFIQAFYYMIGSGISISKSLEIMSSISSENYSKYSKYIYAQINQGFDLCEALESSKIFDYDVISIIKVGEKSSNLVKSLENIWIDCLKKRNQSLESLSKLVEPIFILLCGIIVIIFVSVFIFPLISYENFSNLWEDI